MCSRVVTPHPACRVADKSSCIKNTPDPRADRDNMGEVDCMYNCIDQLWNIIRFVQKRQWQRAKLNKWTKYEMQQPGCHDDNDEAFATSWIFSCLLELVRILLWINIRHRCHFESDNKADCLRNVSLKGRVQLRTKQWIRIAVIRENSNR